MRRLSLLAVLVVAANCGSPAPIKKVDAGAACDSGACGAPCMVDSDCTLGACVMNAQGNFTCVVQCATDSDCHAAGEVCNGQGQCVLPTNVTVTSSGTSTGGSGSHSAST